MDSHRALFATFFSTAFTMVFAACTSLLSQCAFEFPVPEGVLSFNDLVLVTRVSEGVVFLSIYFKPVTSPALLKEVYQANQHPITSLSGENATNSTSFTHLVTGGTSDSSWCSNNVGFWSPSADPFWSTKCSCSEFRDARFSTSSGYYSQVDGDSTVTGKDFALYLQNSSRKIPMDCCYNCEVFAEDVSLFHWPVEEDMGNVSMSKSSTAYTLLSDGFT